MDNVIKFKDLLEARGFKQVVIKTKKYLLYQHPKLKMFFIRIYKTEYMVVPLVNSSHFEYKKELYINFDWNTKSIIFELLKDNEEVIERTNKSKKIKT